jgi:uncharacterized cupredoxin-like copper-binding protein
MKRRVIYFLVLALSLIVSIPVFAHHGTAAYDLSKTVTVKGKVTKFVYINPHVQIYFDVTDDQGNVEHWQAEMTSPNHLSRAGWTKETLKPDDEITITGYRTKDGSNTLWTGKIALRGQELKLESE